MVSDESEKSVFTVVLAAGNSSRFGAVKQLALIDGTPLARRACLLAADWSPTRNVLVVGYEWQAVVDACAPLPGYLVINDAYSKGIGSSIASAVRVLRRSADAIIVLLADQPLISRSHIEKLVATWSGDRNEIVTSVYAGSMGVPTLFASACFADLAELSGDQGARALFADARFQLRSVVFEDAAVDIDTAEDLANFEHSARS